MKFYSGFSLADESSFFTEFIDNSVYNICGFSYGAIKAFEDVKNSLRDEKRVDRLQLFSPAFFQTKDEKFKRLQLMAYNKNREVYLNNFIKSCFYPYKIKELKRSNSTISELKELLNYRWDLKELEYLTLKGVKIEVYLGGKDSVIDVQGAREFFLKVATVTYIKNANHFLQRSQKMPRKLISFDWAIKRILRGKANFDILEGFLSELLYEDVKILEILESESNKDIKEDKSNRLDIKVKNSYEEIIIIEIQYDREMDFLQRMLYGASKVISEHIKEGEPYSSITKVISINILYFNFGDGDDYIYKGTTNFIGIHDNSKLELTSKQKTVFKSQSINKLYPQYYIIKIANFNDIAKDSLDEWIYFLKNETIKDNFEAKGLKKAKETLDYLQLEDDERREYEAFQKSLHDKASAYESTYVSGHIDGEKRGLKIGIKKGIEKGIELERLNSEKRLKQEKIEIAKNLLDVLDTETISIKTGLSVEEIEDIKNSLNL